MTISELGSIGDFVSSIGVIVSLVYLAIQIRKGAEAARTSTYQSIVSDFGALNGTIAATPELSFLFVNGMENFEDLEPDQKARVSQLFFAVFHFFENMFYQYRNGYLEDDVWLGWKRLMLAYYARPGFQAWWSARRDVYSESFANFLASSTPDKAVASYLDITRLKTG